MKLADIFGGVISLYLWPESTIHFVYPMKVPGKSCGQYLWRVDEGMTYWKAKFPLE